MPPEHETWDFGWRRDPDQVARFLATLARPTFAMAAPGLMGMGADQTVLLYKAWKDVNGAYVPYPKQTIGDCVSHGFGHGVDLLECVQIAINNRSEEFHQTCTEAVYGMSRVDIGGQHGSYQDGSVGAWAAKAVSTIGTLDRNTCGPYDGNRAKEWGAKGVPDQYEKLAPKHQVKTVALVSTWEELCASLANGYPVPVCSDQGFTMTRDQEGFCKPSGTWNHCMLIAAVRADNRPGACIVQSWGENVPGGPVSLDQPNYSFWADRKVVERMLGMRDTWALSSFDGYPGQSLPTHWTYAGFA